MGSPLLPIVHLACLVRLKAPTCAVTALFRSKSRARTLAKQFTHQLPKRRSSPKSLKCRTTPKTRKRWLAVGSALSATPLLKINALCFGTFHVPHVVRTFAECCPLPPWLVPAMRAVHFGFRFLKCSACDDLGPSSLPCFRTRSNARTAPMCFGRCPCTIPIVRKSADT